MGASAQLFVVYFGHFVFLNFCKFGPNDLKLSETMHQMNFKKVVYESFPLKGF